MVPEKPNDTESGVVVDHINQGDHVVVDSNVDTTSMMNTYWSEPVKSNERMTTADDDPDDPASSNASTDIMSERMQRIASVIYREFEAMIETHGQSVVERLMPVVVELLESLDELYKDQASYHAEVDELREEHAFLTTALDQERHGRKNAEMRLLQTEDAFDEERKVLDVKLQANTLNIRQLEIKLQNAQDQVSRLTARESDSKKEIMQLHERINELIRHKVDLTDQLKFAMRSSGSDSTVSGNKLKLPFRPSGSTYSTSVPNPSVPESMYDATSGGFGFDEMPSTDEGIPLDDELPDESIISVNVTSTVDNDVGGFAGMRKEIDILIKENMDLVETKNALNVVKDDLISRIDALSCENISLHESVAQLSHARASLQSELASTDQLLNDTRAELESLKQQAARASDYDSGSSLHRRRFTRAEMARVVSDRNHYKELFMELQEAVRLTETLRAGQKGHPDLLTSLVPSFFGPGTRPRPIVQTQAASSSSPPQGPRQSLQRLFSRISISNWPPS